MTAFEITRELWKAADEIEAERHLEEMAAWERHEAEYAQRDEECW